MVQNTNMDWTVFLQNGQHRFRLGLTEAKGGGGQDNRQHTRHKQTSHGPRANIEHATNSV